MTGLLEVCIWSFVAFAIMASRGSKKLSTLKEIYHDNESVMKKLKSLKIIIPFVF